MRAEGLCGHPPQGVERLEPLQRCCDQCKNKSRNGDYFIRPRLCAPCYATRAARVSIKCDEKAGSIYRRDWNEPPRVCKVVLTCAHCKGAPKCVECWGDTVPLLCEPCGLLLRGAHLSKQTAQWWPPHVKRAMWTLLLCRERWKRTKHPLRVLPAQFWLLHFGTLLL